jgi:hypothetical protein
MSLSCYLMTLYLVPILCWFQSDYHRRWNKNDTTVNDVDSVTAKSAWFWAQISIISENSVNQLIVVIVKCCVFFEVRTKFLNIIYTSFGFKGLHITRLFHWRLQAIPKKNDDFWSALVGRECENQWNLPKQVSWRCLNKREESSQVDSRLKWRRTNGFNDGRPIECVTFWGSEPDR